MDELQNDTLEQTGVDTTTENEPEVLPEADDSKLKELEAQKRHWREKALKETEARQKLEAQLAKIKPQPVDPDQFASKDDLARLELGQQGYDSATISGIMTYAKGSGKNPLAVLEDEFVKDFIASRKAKSRVEEATPSPSNRTISVPLEKPYSQMSESERKEHFEKNRLQFFKK